MIPFDPLRPPWPFEPTASGYKDWLHVNVFDHASGSVGLVNVSLHGHPADPRARAVGTALVHRPGGGWAGNVVVRALAEAAVGVSSVSVEGVAVGVDHRAGLVLASASLPEDDFALDLTGVATAPALDPGVPSPLGSGWIGWYAVPRLAVSGELATGGERIRLTGAGGYHDHNWGRWHWGEDFGWEWGAFVAAGNGPAVVVSRVTDRAHRVRTPLRVDAVVDDRHRVFAGAEARLVLEGMLGARPRRLPGAQAALHAVRTRPRLPARVGVAAAEGADRLDLEFHAGGAAQLIAADPVHRGYTFIHEIAGAFRCRGRVGGVEVDTAGLGIFEYVD